MHVCAVRFFFLSNHHHPLFPFSLCRLAIFATAVVTIAIVPHLLPTFSPCDSLIITVCKVDRVAATLQLLKIGRKGDWGGTREGGVDPHVNGTRHCSGGPAIGPPHLPLPLLPPLPSSPLLPAPSTTAMSPTPFVVTS
ncbi:hypothetical protein CVT25_015070 [Psilocybe cyanescens]|uniref:Uncharacterized protein n=1 Tax=Psilocybe cyanescens TaxID=93625 RepID=A0A409WS06_PSICY|nr:hypothetical protein CVT25_015070 [Psilocybe cyanescens]